MKQEAKRLFYIFIGAALYAAGIQMFIVPQGLYTGGLTGYGVLLVNIVARQGILLNLGIVVFFVNLPAYIFGYFKVSLKFVFHSLVGLSMQSILLAFPIFPNLPVENPLTAAVFGGLFMGAGVAMVLRQGAALGGLSVISQYINIRYQSSIGYINLVSNAGVIVLSALLFSPMTALYTLLVFVMVSVVVDRLYTSYRRVKMEIITEHGEAIKAMLLAKFPHGMTVIEAKGGYTGKDKTLFFMIMYSHEAYSIKQAIVDIDPNAYITREDVYMMNGLFNYVQLP
jgi:uncharacterized membrane-anchored protein YitT (DUF2179 family)